MEKKEQRKALLCGGVLAACAALLAAGFMAADFTPFEDVMVFFMDYVGVA